MTNIGLGVYRRPGTENKESLMGLFDMLKKKEAPVAAPAAPAAPANVEAYCGADELC